MLSTQLAIRLARRWQKAWEATRKPPPALDHSWKLLESRFDLIRRVQQRLNFARGGLFPRGVRKLTSDLGDHLDQLARSADRLREEITLPRPPAVGLGDWLADVRQLEAEFGAVEVKWKETTVRAVTEPITLRNVEFGPFAIDFHWDRLDSHRGVDCFDVVALEPNPAAGHDDVVHPHVRKGDLCAGDSEGPVQRALEQGRFADAFLLIRSVLITYNPSSPYVKIEQWSGSPCSDCGGRVGDEDRYACEGCETDLCDNCTRFCAACGSTRCHGCLDECALCHADCCSSCLEAREDERICSRCFARCSLCGGRVPKDELVDRRCPDCTLDEETDDDDDPVEAAEAAE